MKKMIVFGLVLVLLCSMVSAFDLINHDIQVDTNLLVVDGSEISSAERFIVGDELSISFQETTLEADQDFYGIFYEKVGGEWIIVFEDTVSVGAGGEGTFTAPIPEEHGVLLLAYSLGGADGSFDYFYVPATESVDAGVGEGIVIPGDGSLSPDEVIDIPDDVYTPIITDGGDSGYGIINYGGASFIVPSGEGLPVISGELEILLPQLKGMLVLVGDVPFNVNNGVDWDDWVKDNTETSFWEG